MSKSQKCIQFQQNDLSPMQEPYHGEKSYAFLPWASQHNYKSILINSVV